MKTIFFASIFLFASGNAHSFSALRPQVAPAGNMESVFRNLSLAAMEAMPDLEIDPACRAPTLPELFPDYRGNFASVRRSTSYPPVIFQNLTVSQISVDGRLQYPPDYLCEANRRSSCWSSSRGGDFLVSEANLEVAATRGICLRRQPQNTGEVFSASGDFPAEFLSLWSGSYLRYRWERAQQGGMAAVRARFPDNDVTSLYDLNLRAAGLWEKMLACNSGQAEAARASYAQARFNCASGNSLVLEIAEFRRDLRDYFHTSFFQQAQLLPRTSLDLVIRVLEGNPLVDLTVSHKFPSIHPLLSQVVLEFQLELFVGDQDFDARQLGEIIQARALERFANSVNQFYHYVEGGEAQNFGFWPVGARSARHWLKQKLIRIIASET